MINGGVPVASGVDALWGKSNAGGRPNLLVQHLLDTAAVGEIVWDAFLAPAVCRRWDAATDGRGRALFTMLCGLHDVGKASPAFQSKVPELAQPVRAAGLTWRRLSGDESSWHHTRAGARILREVLPDAGWTKGAVNWVWPLIAGHHGKVPAAIRLTPPGLGGCHGLGPAWRVAQEGLVELISAELELDLSDLADVHAASRADQLALLGALVMADWVASNDAFPGVADFAEVSLSAARQRADSGWAALGLRGGWSPTALPVPSDPITSRFRVQARPAQEAVVAVACDLAGPGLLIVEAPMGEGKTEAALAAAEVLARACGADGLFVGMPTQATSDPMFSRVRAWAEQLDPDAPVALLHGKAIFNREWRRLREHITTISGVDEYAMDEPYGPMSAGEAPPSHSQAPAEWLLGRKRGLLTPIVVGTVDQLLQAATRTRHVMLRHAGLAGKVVVLDEVHAYDVYMSQFLHEALRWLAEGGVPVVLLSATIPPATRTELIRSYLQGRLGVRDVEVAAIPKTSGYPGVLGVSTRAGAPVFIHRAAPPWRESSHVGVEVLEEAADESLTAVVRLLEERLADGGCALVVRNTVRRAQQTHLALRRTYGTDTVLLHARLTAGERADRTQRVLDLLGPVTAGRSRPQRLVVVATQLAEQSFDVDADLLVTDLAPIDLLLQRIGRLHRHARDPESRPGRVRQPRVVVAGLLGGVDSAPSFPAGSVIVYGRHLLLRAAGQVLDAAQGSGAWSVPADVPALVELGYAEAFPMPEAWAETAREAQAQWEQSQRIRRARASQFLLAGPEELGAPTLAGLHERFTSDLDDDDLVAAVVRDAEPTLEVVLVRHGDRGYLGLDGRSLGVHGDAVSDPDVLERVVRDTVRLPPAMTQAAVDTLRPLEGWVTEPWLARARALVLDEDLSATLGQWALRYDRDLGLLVSRADRKGNR